MKSILDYEVLEWSESQRCFHSYSIKDMLECNRKNIARGASIDYVPIAIAETYTDLQIIKDTEFKHLQKRHA